MLISFVHDRGSRRSPGAWSSEVKRVLANLQCQDCCWCNSTRTSTNTYVRQDKISVQAFCLDRMRYRVVGSVAAGMSCLHYPDMKKKKKRKNKRQIYTETKLVYKRWGNHSTLADDIIVEGKSNYLRLLQESLDSWLLLWLFTETVIRDTENMTC